MVGARGGGVEQHLAYGPYILGARGAGIKVSCHGHMRVHLNNL